MFKRSIKLEDYENESIECRRLKETEEKKEIGKEKETEKEKGNNKRYSKRKTRYVKILKASLKF